MEHCESHFAHLRHEKAIAEECLVRHFLGIQQAREVSGLDEVFWLPGPGNPADGPTRKESGMVPLCRMLKSGSFCPGARRPLRGDAFIFRCDCSRNSTLLHRASSGFFVPSDNHVLRGAF